MEGRRKEGRQVDNRQTDACTDTLRVYLADTYKVLRYMC